VFEPGVPSGESQPAPDAAPASSTDGAPESGGPDTTSPTPAAQGGAELLARLAQTARDLELAERIARIGSWTLDPATGRATWSTETYRILGLDPADPPIDLAEIGRIFTPESVARVGAAVERTVATGEPWHLDLEFVRPDGRHGWVVSNGIAERDASGRVVLIRGTMQDVTEQRELEAQLRQAQRLEAIGQLAGGIAHDFNNLLTAIRGYAELVLANLAPNDPNRPDIEQIVVAADRATELIRQLLAFSRRQVLRPAVVDPRELVERIAPLLRRLLGAHIEVITAVAAGVGRIRVDPTQFEQVIVNLAVNARDAMPEGGRLVIEVANVDLDAAYAANHADATPGPHVVLVVSDTGTGMDEATRERIFEPFFTTKPPGQGMGMGLATVYGIVKQSGGSIYVYSEPGHGTSFKVYLPRVEAAEGATEAVGVGDEGPLPRGGETILVVEDEDAVRDFAVRTLAGLGYRILEAADPRTALAIAATHAGPIDLLLTDVTMPGLQGYELAEQLAATRPGLRVLYVSGFSENALAGRGPGPEAAFLGKPFSGDALARAVRRALDTPPRARP
jgi:two-component system cell cycle sensor histidine kinase/response regulator CckA